MRQIYSKNIEHPPASWERYATMYRQQIRRSNTLQIMFHPSEVLPWCAACKGVGHYFYTAEAVLAYCAGRGYISYGIVHDLAFQLDDKAKRGDYALPAE